VNLIEDAEKDILELYRFIAESDSAEKADYVYKNIRDVCLSPDEFANRGHYPPELERIGLTQYREIHFKPYRIIYQVLDTDVFIHCVLDERRDLQAVLERRLLR
jgi:toxin ParE1/3/4